MFRRARNNGAIVLLVVMGLIAMQIGQTLGRALTLFSIMVWICAIGLFVYLTLFRNMKISLFRKPSKVAVVEVETMDAGEVYVETVERGGSVLVDEGDVVVRSSPDR